MVGPLELPTISRFGVTLRPWRLTDAPALSEACGDERILRFTTVPARYTTIGATDWIRRGRERADHGAAIVLAIVKAGEQLPVGMVGLFGLDRDDQAARLGYWVLGRARRGGLAFAAASALTAWGFDRLGLEHVVIDVEPNNLASARIAQKLGAIETGEHLVEHHGSDVTLVRYVVDRG